MNRSEVERDTLVAFIASLVVMTGIAMLALATVGIAWSVSAYSQGYPHSPAGQHDKYGDIRNRKGELCCNRNDCHKIVKEEEVRILPEGGYHVKPIKGDKPEFVLEEKVADSPDEHWHICREYSTGPGGYVPNGKVRCLMIPQGGY